MVDDLILSSRPQARRVSSMDLNPIRFTPSRSNLDKYSPQTIAFSFALKFIIIPRAHSTPILRYTPQTPPNPPPPARPGRRRIARIAAPVLQ